MHIFSIADESISCRLTQIFPFRLPFNGIRIEFWMMSAYNTAPEKGWHPTLKNILYLFLSCSFFLALSSSSPYSWIRGKKRNAFPESIPFSTTSPTLLFMYIFMSSCRREKCIWIHHQEREELLSILSHRHHSFSIFLFRWHCMNVILFMWDTFIQPNQEEMNINPQEKEPLYHENALHIFFYTRMHYVCIASSFLTTREDGIQFL